MAQRDDLEDESLSSSSTEDASEQSQDSLPIQRTSRPDNITHLSPYTVPGNLASPKPVFHTEMQHVKDNIGTSGGTPNEEEKKKEHKKRSKNWTRLETLKLIKARTELDEKFRRSGKKVALWDEIALSLKKDSFSRDGQQCKDKWEKLTAGYKEVRDGAREKEDHPFYEELHSLLSWKSYKRENEASASGDGISIRRDEGLSDGNTGKRVKFEFTNERFTQGWNQQIGTSYPVNSQGDSALDMRDAQKHEQISPLKLSREGSSSLVDFEAIQELLETVIIKQQMFFKGLLDSVERKEQLREKMRYEREEKWRAEERTQRYAFSNAMIALTHRLLGEKQTVSTGATPSVAPTETPPTDGTPGPKKRSKNWKKSEVFTLIRLRREMEGKFSQSTRRAALWEELGEKLGSLGIQRDGKQCREKWDKLMAEYKDVTDGRKDEEESPYFKELSTFLVKFKEPEEVRPAIDVTKKEVLETSGPTENNF